MNIVREADDQSTLVVEFWLKQQDSHGKVTMRRVRIRVEDDRVMVAPEGYGTVDHAHVDGSSHWPVYMGFNRYDQFHIDYSYHNDESYQTVFVTPQHARDWKS